MSNLAFINPDRPHPVTDTDQYPAEVYVISALVDSGVYEPTEHGLSLAMFDSYKRIHHFCAEHQAQAGRAPALTLLRRKFSDFPYHPDVSIAWAASQLRHEHHTREYRRAFAESGRRFKEGDLEGAEAAFRAYLDARDRAHGVDKPIGMDDLEVLVDPATTYRIPLGLSSGKRSMRLLDTYLGGGITAGQLMLIAARFGVGKSFMLMVHAVAAMEAGYDVAYFSAEMTAPKVLQRIHRIALRNDKAIDWRNPDQTALKTALDRWQDGKGRLLLYPPGKDVTPKRVAAVVRNNVRPTLAVIDYLGLMRTNDGKSTSEDWATAGRVTTELHDECVRSGGEFPVIAAAQVNRRGEGAKEVTSDMLGTSDRFGADADIIVTLKFVSDRVRVTNLAKNRDAQQNVQWFSSFNPTTSDFSDLPSSLAYEMQAEDEEKKNRHL